MSKKAQQNDLTESFSDIRKSLIEKNNESKTAVSGIPDIVTFIENKNWLGLPHRANPINLYPMQRIVLKSFYRGSLGNEKINLSDEEIKLCWQRLKQMNYLES